MQLFCPTCNAGVRFQDINAQTKMAKCRFCSAEFSVATFLEDQFEDDTNEKPKKQKIIDMPRPGMVTIREDGLDLLLIRKWSVMTGLGSLLFGAVWLGFIAFFIFGARSGTNFRMIGSMNSSVLPLFFGIFLLVGIGMVGKGIYNILNSTTLRLNRDNLTLTHHPLPWFGKNIYIKGLQQVFVRQHITTTRSKNGTRTTITYSLNIVTANGTQEQLQNGLQADAALFIEQEIEKKLSLENIAVRGEFGKGGWAI